jgi:hypothetical protein
MGDADTRAGPHALALFLDRNLMAFPIEKGEGDRSLIAYE